MDNAKLIKLTITDQTGHSEFEVTVTEAVQRIVKEMKEFGKFLYVNDEPQHFEHNFSTEDVTSLTHILENASEATLTGALVGGTSRDKNGRFVSKSRSRSTSRSSSRRHQSVSRVVSTKGIITSKPLSLVLNDHNRAQIAVSLSSDSGKSRIKVFFSDYNGSRTKLRKHVVPIVAAIVEGLK